MINNDTLYATFFVSSTACQNVINEMRHQDLAIFVSFILSLIRFFPFLCFDFFLIFLFWFFLFSNVYFLQVFIQIMTEMYVCSKEKGIWGGLFLSDEKSQKSSFLGYAVVGTTAQPLILWAIVFCCCFSVGGDNIRAAQQNEVECILAQNTICKIT